jgi:hypothetical protein
MRSDPELLYTVRNWNTKRAMMQPNTNAAEISTPYQAEMQRGMCLVPPEQLVVAAGKLLSRKGVEALPEPSGR